MVNHHQILHIRISLSCKFQLQQTILIFWNKFTRKMNPSGQKKKKKKKKMDITIESFILELA